MRARSLANRKMSTRRIWLVLINVGRHRRRIPQNGMTVYTSARILRPMGNSKNLRIHWCIRRMHTGTHTEQLSAR